MQSLSIWNADNGDGTFTNPVLYADYSDPDAIRVGEDWFLHFQDVYAAGRIIHLQPMKWENDWPVIGIAKAGNDYGEPVATYKKPDVGKVYEKSEPVTSDDFSDRKLNLAWQWNVNTKDNWNNFTWYKLWSCGF